MALVDIVDLADLGAVYVSEESPYGSTGTERRCFPVVGSVEHAETQAELAVKSLKPRPHDKLDPVKGLKDGTAKLGYYLQPPPTVLNDAATADTDANNPLAVFLRCLFGAQSVAAGSKVASGATATGCVVTASHGGRLLPGQLALATDPDAAVGLVPIRVLTRATDTITWYPNLSGAPAVGSDLINLWTFYVSRTNTRSLSLAVANGQDANFQWRHNGVTGGFELSFKRGELAMASFDLKSGSWTGPSALGLATTDATDPMAAPIAARACTLYLQTTATTTRVNYAIDEFVVRVRTANAHLPTLTGGTDGKRGVMRHGEELTDAVAEIELTFAADTVPDATWWTSRSALTCMFFLTFDPSGGGRRAIVVDAPRCIVVGKPQYVPGEGRLTKTKLVLHAKLDTSTTQGTELAEAGLRLGIG